MHRMHQLRVALVATLLLLLTACASTAFKSQVGGDFTVEVSKDAETK